MIQHYRNYYINSLVDDLVLLNLEHGLSMAVFEILSMHITIN